jgi:hypothetical protein
LAGWQGPTGIVFNIGERSNLANDRPALVVFEVGCLLVVEVLVALEHFVDYHLALVDLVEVLLTQVRVVF